LVKFWDTSAIVPLCVAEPASRQARGILEADPSMIVWWATRTECVSAVARRRRDGQLTARAEQQSRQILTALATAWAEILPNESLRARSERLLAVHPLRAADAFQLAAALLWSRGETANHTIFSFDDRLREAALREGFAVLPG
jgi:predicted nucleic acid-binding protein